MNQESNFRFKNATFDFHGGAETNVQLVAAEADNTNGIHITLLMGANGTCKSRLLSSCVDLLRKFDESNRKAEANHFGKLRRIDRDSSSSLCLRGSLESNGVSFKFENSKEAEAKECLPNRVLAIANLVRDRFTFVDSEDENESRYYYLGVRQSSNLTTTGAMDRITTDAFLRIAVDRAKTETFVTWVRNLFPECLLGIRFEQNSSSRIEKFLLNPIEFLKVEQQSTRYNGGWFKRNWEKVESALPSVVRLFQFLRTYAQRHQMSSGKNSRHSDAWIFQPEKMSSSVQAEFADLMQSMTLIFTIAVGLRLISRPAIVMKNDEWLDFSSLSSGEQNLVSTGARLIGYAVPASFIAIDEPEVSLNVAWQQRYIELIQGALVHAQGSHVVIASHSPYLVSDLNAYSATIVVAERSGNHLTFKSQPSKFWGWGSETILYEVLGIPSASNFLFGRELAAILKQIDIGSKDRELFENFLDKCAQLELPADAEPLRIVIDEISQYFQTLNT